MPKYKVTFTERLIYEYHIEASNPTEAESKARERWNDDYYREEWTKVEEVGLPVIEELKDEQT